MCQHFVASRERCDLNELAAASFTGLVDLPARSFGVPSARATSSSPRPITYCCLDAVFIPDKFTDRGKWMDGWESRRAHGYDFCILELGSAAVLGFDIDTQHLIGNHPSFDSRSMASTPPRAAASLNSSQMARAVATGAAAAELAEPVRRRGRRTRHAPAPEYFPMGRALSRAFGKVHASWQPATLDAETRAHVGRARGRPGGARTAGITLACSDARFGPMNNVLLPGQPCRKQRRWLGRRTATAAPDTTGCSCSWERAAACRRSSSTPTTSRATTRIALLSS